MAHGSRPRAGWIGFSLTLLSLGCASTGMNPDETRSPLPLPSRLPAPNSAGVNAAAMPAGATGNPTLPPKLNVSPPAHPQATRRPAPTDAGFTDLRSASTIATPTMPTTAGMQYAQTNPVRPASHVTPVQPTAPTIVPASATVPASAPPIATPTPPATTVSTDRWKEAAPTAGLTSPIPVEKPPTVTATVEPPEAGWIQEVPPLRDRTSNETPTTGGVMMPGPITSAAGGK